MSADLRRQQIQIIMAAVILVMIIPATTILDHIAVAPVFPLIKQQ